jgi:hypothetical protein
VQLHDARIIHLEALDHDRESGTEKHDLSVLGVESKKLLDNGGEFGRKQLISLIHYECLASREIRHALSSQIQDPTRCSNNDVNRLAQTYNIVFEACSTSRNHDVDTQVLSKRLAYLRCLESELPGRDKNQCLCFGALGVDAFEGRDDEGGGLSGAVLCSCKDVSSGEGYRDGLFLDRRRLLETRLEDAHHELALDEEIFEFEAFGRGNILCQDNQLRGRQQRLESSERCAGQPVMSNGMRTSVCGRASLVGAVSPSFQWASAGGDASLSLVAAN